MPTSLNYSFHISQDKNSHFPIMLNNAQTQQRKKRANETRLFQLTEIIKIFPRRLILVQKNMKFKSAWNENRRHILLKQVKQ